MTDHWQDQAYCRTVHGGHNVAAFADARVKGELQVQRHFQKLCNTMCPVREQCLEFALAIEQPMFGTDVLNHNSRFGVYGGMSPLQREREARRRAGEIG